jgi:HlyD family secretion protein
MDEVDAGRLRAGLAARITVDSHPGRVFAARVVRVAPYVVDVEAQNRTVAIEVELDEPEVSLLPGTSADVEVVLAARDDVLRVPAAALLSGERVLAADADDRLVERTVATGLRNWEFVEVTSGLAAGERVVVTLDRPEIRAGARIDPQPAAP